MPRQVTTKEALSLSLRGVTRRFRPSALPRNIKRLFCCQRNASSDPRSSKIPSLSTCPPGGIATCCQISSKMNSTMDELSQWPDCGAGRRAGAGPDHQLWWSHRYLTEFSFRDLLWTKWMLRDGRVFWPKLQDSSFFVWNENHAVDGWLMTSKSIASTSCLTIKVKRRQHFWNFSSASLWRTMWASPTEWAESADVPGQCL